MKRSTTLSMTNNSLDVTIIAEDPCGNLAEVIGVIVQVGRVLEWRTINGDEDVSVSIRVSPAPKGIKHITLTVYAEEGYELVDIESSSKEVIKTWAQYDIIDNGGVLEAISSVDE